MDYINMEWLNDGVDSQLTQDIPLSPSSPHDFDVDSVINPGLFEYYLGGLGNYDSITSANDQIEPLINGGVVSPSDLLASTSSTNSPIESLLTIAAATAATTSSSLNYHSPSIDSSADSACDVDFDMQIKQEPIDTAELIRELDARVAAMTAASRAAQEQSDKSAADAQMSGLETIKEEFGTDEKADGEELLIDTKKLTSKERRQLRNKISARNFRVRRKEYISTLESQVSLHQMEARELREKLLAADIENERLRAENTILCAHAASTNAELEELRQSLSAARLAPSTTDHFKDSLTLATALTITRPSPTLSEPNLNKDVSITGTRPGFMDNTRTLVSSFEVPEWDVEKILEEHRAIREGLSEKPVAVPAVKPADSAIMVSMVVCAVMEKLWDAFVQGLVNVPADQMVDTLFPPPVIIPEEPLTPAFLDDELSCLPTSAAKDAIIITEPPVRSQQLDLAFPADYLLAARYDSPYTDAPLRTSTYFDWLYDTMVMAAVLVGSSQEIGRGASEEGIEFD